MLPKVCQVYPRLVGEIIEMGSTTYDKYLGLLLLTTP
jgi:hypothetical protein